MMELTPVSRAEQALAQAATPQESKQVEALAAAAKAWAKEQGDFELTFEAALIYILARCKTTQLITPTIRQGQHGRETNDIVRFSLVADYGFTDMQWHRRKRELEAIERFDSYQDDCVEKRVIPTPFGLVGFASNVHVSNASCEWYTPAVYVDAVREVLGGIDLDPASCEEANKIVKAKKFYTIEDDGLAHDWAGLVFVNPPYEIPTVANFTAKLAREYESGFVYSGICLVNNATDAIWFQKLLKYPVCFPQGRVKFTKPGGEAGGPRQGQAFFYLGEKIDKFKEIFCAFGEVLKKYGNEV